MTDRESYTTETIDHTLVVQVTQSSLVFHDQLRTIEDDLKSLAEAASIRSVVLDFSGVKHISSSVWGEMIRLNENLKQDDRQLRLCNLNDHLREALAFMKLDLVACATRQDALDDLNG